jgi:hypothetical protein
MKPLSVSSILGLDRAGLSNFCYTDVIWEFVCFLPGRRLCGYPLLIGALVAQLGRASDRESAHRVFESPRSASDHFRSGVLTGGGQAYKSI